ncbi:MAG: alpha-N-arabinofuranosidase [Catenulispora sp.]|nr:alpha-N-arabinofuranosidase [Catenulispora sp.]
MGRCVYTGVYEPGHPRADADGFRRDVLDLVRELGVTTVRYPGGNFVSNYRWEDGVGPVEQRPRRLDLAWHGIETNEFGLHEFDRWAKAAGVEPMMAVNLGTRGLTEAVDLLEYANHPDGTRLSDLRVAHGAKEPFGIGMWCLGNEMDGPWQVGHKDADAYGRLAAETAKAMRLVDASLELVVCGSSSAQMPTFGAWEATVLEHTYEHVDYISCHAYYEPRDGDLASFLSSAADMDGFIEAVVATADHVRAKKRSNKRIAISFDEWNVWYLDRFQASGGEQDWQVAPRVIEDEYNVADAVVVGGLLISLLRHSDRVTAASLAQLVNVIAPIRSEPGGPAWRQTTFHPFALTARHAAGTVLTTLVETSHLETKRHGEVPAVDAVVTHDPDQGTLTVFAVNRNLAENAELVLDMRPFPGYRAVEHIVLTEPDLTLTNTQGHPDRVVPRDAGRMTEGDGAVTAVLPPASWNMLRLAERL